MKQRSKKIEVADVAGPIRVGPPRVEDMWRFPPVSWPTPREDLQKNLEKYRRLALDLGAVDVKSIHTKDIPQDLRAYFIGCVMPMCRWLNSNANCPTVTTFPFDHMRKFIAEYDFAIVYKVLPPVMNAVPDVGPIELDMYYTMGGGEPQCWLGI